MEDNKHLTQLITDQKRESSEQTKKLTNERNFLTSLG